MSSQLEFKSAPLIAATYILFFIGLLGAFDTQYFHNTSHKLRENTESRQELWIHALRGPTYGSLFILIPNFKLYGTFFWLLICLLLLETVISLWDFYIEGDSRRRHGGLPKGEYVLHIIIAMLFGAMTACIFYDVYDWHLIETGLIYDPVSASLFVRCIMLLMALALMVSSAQDCLAAFRMRKIQGNAA